MNSAMDGSLVADAMWTVDTNILVYAMDVDSGSPKPSIARAIVAKFGDRGRGCLPGQVLGEFANVVQRKRMMPATQVHVILNSWPQSLTVLGASPSAYGQAFGLVAKHHYQVWDALIIAVCAEHGVKTLYSEDLGSLKRPLGVHVVNPFAELEKA